MPLHRRLGSVMIFAASLGGCTIGQMLQLSKPKPATAPEPASFPEAESAFRSASFEHPLEGRLIRAYVTSDAWVEAVDGSSRAADLVLYDQRKGGLLVKGDDGSESEVCFQHACTLVQQRLDGGFIRAIIKCPDTGMRKVTCESVSTFPRGLEQG